jgi:glycine betaine/proline transport system ATP-binding protein
MSTENSGSSIEIQNVSKIFGNTSQEALEAIKNKRVTKQDPPEN